MQIVEIDFCRDADILQIYCIEQECFGHFCCPLECIDRDIRERSGENYYLKATQIEHILGYVAVERLVDQVHITSLAVRKQYQRQGIASQLLLAVEETASYMGYSSLFLEVRVSNGAAQALYGSCGYRRLSTRKQFYRDGEDALIYTKYVK